MKYCASLAPLVLLQSPKMNEEARVSKTIKMKASIVRKAHHKAIEEGKSLGRWVEDAIEEKIEREEDKVK